MRNVIRYNASYMLNCHKAIENFVKIIFPSRCFICDKIISGGHFCADDWKKIHFLHQPACEICFWPFEFNVEGKFLCASCIANRPTYFKSVSVIKYDEFSKSLITKFKYSDKTYIAKYFAELMFNHGKEMLKNVDFITSVPLHKFRLIKRKYNQSALISNHIAKLSGKKVVNDLLIRNRNTKAQAGLSKKSRSKNMAGVFVLNKKYQQEIKRKNILLIDDVITTGATIENCSKVLMKSGIDKIYVLTLAKTILD